MAAAGWRVWLYDALQDIGSVYGDGSLEVAPAAKPFVIIKMGPENLGPFPGVSFQDCTIWVHDEPGDYLRIDSVLGDIKDRIAEGNRAIPGLVGAVWQGDSADLADDGFKTITRNTNYRLAGRT